MAASYHWPAGLPLPRLAWDGEPEAMKVETPVLSGRLRQRATFAEGPVRANARFAFQGLHYAAWKSIFHRTLLQGTLPLIMPLDAGYGLLDHEVQFIGGYKFRQTGANRWEVTTKLQIIRPDIIDEATAEILAATQRPADVLPFFDRLEIFAESDMPSTLGDLP